MLKRILTLLVGRRLATEEDHAERIGPWAGVGVLGLGALASAAYAPEALLTVLRPLGVAGLSSLWVLTPLILLLLVIVSLSYRQSIPAYSDGGGTYTVSRENLGEELSLLSAAALALDYVLNVAVAIAAGAGALVSALPSLQPHTLPLCLTLLGLLTLVNLRGVRSAGALFIVPTYLFVGCLFGLIAYGLVKAAAGDVVAVHAAAPSEAGPPPISFWLMLRAFATGCSALTGVEGVSNGVPLFKDPPPRKARRTLGIITVTLAVLLAGELALCRLYGVIARPPGEEGYRSLISELLEAVTGRGVFYFLTIGSIVLVLALSANTSFASFPRLCGILAGHKYLPEPFVHRGRRLAFSYGILVLSALGAVILIVFGGVTDRLIPLFAIAAFVVFTVSQAGMAVHWRKQQGLEAKCAMVMNAVGACITLVALVVILVAGFSEGAWLSVLLIGAMMFVFHRVRAHYDFIAKVTPTPLSLSVGPARAPVVVVPLRRWDAVSLKALRFAIGFAEEVIAVQVLTQDRELDDLRERWHELAEVPTRAQGLRPPKLVVLATSYRKLYDPLLKFVMEIARHAPDRPIAVVIPELVERRWYHRLLHNRSASLLRRTLIVRGGPQVVVISAPWYLEEWQPEQRRLRRWRRVPH